MMIKKDGVVSIIAGRESFHSAFRSGNRKIRNLAHRKLVEEMRARGYTKNGKRRDSLEIPTSLEKMDWTQLHTVIGEFLSWTKTLDDIKDPEPMEFWGNPDTNQRIPVETLMIATDFWPLDEVLEMVPLTQANS